MKRRDVLKLIGASASVLATPFSTRIARAALRSNAPAKRLLIINLSGGVRSSAAFLASTKTKYNPWGLIQGTGALPLGTLLDDTSPAATLDPASGWSGETLPSLRELAANNAFSVLGTWHTERGDHLRARIEEPTGSANGDEPGILSRVHGALAQHGAPEAIEIPPIHLRPAATFGLAKGELARWAPVTLDGAEALPSATQDDAETSASVGHRWVKDEAMRDRLDVEAIADRRGRAKELAEIFAVHRRAARSVGHRLADPFVNVTASGAELASLGMVTLASGQSAPLTNAMLRELFTRVDAGSGNETAAMDVATAIRLLQMGSAAVAVEIQNFDFHSGERNEAPALYSFLGRVLSAIHFILSRLGMLDSTMVVTMSDFGRDPGEANGFNPGDGSDHGTDASCFYLAHAVMGAGIGGGRVIAGVDTANYDARREPFRASPRQLLASMMWALGLPEDDERWGFPELAGPITGLFGG